VSGKGIGLVATRNIRRKTVVIQEQPVLTLSSEDAFEETLLRLFMQLSTEIQEKVLNFYDYLGPDNEGGDMGSILAKLVRIVQFNAIETEDKIQGVKKSLYLSASLLNHSCRPNLVWYPEDGGIVVRCLYPVEKGDKLTVCYFSLPLSNYTRGSGCPTLAQRKEKLAPYRFDCCCDLCIITGEGEEQIRLEFQELDREQDMENCGSLVEQLVSAQRRLEIADQVKDQSVFIALIDCWKLSQFVSELCDDNEERQELRNLSNSYRMRAAGVADILGPVAREAMDKFLNVSLETINV